MNRTAQIATLVAAGAMLACGQPVAAATKTVQLIQPGDSAMTCEALAAEINSLSEGQAKAAKRAQGGRKVLGFASGALSMAGPLLGGALSGGDGATGLIAQQAMGALQAQAMMAQTPGAGDAVAAAGASVEVQRMARLSQLFAGKSC